MDRHTMTQNNNTDLYSVDYEDLRMFRTEPPSTTSGSDESGSDDEDEDDEDDEDDDESESETEYEYVSDNDYDSEKENYDEILHVHQLIIKELGDIYDTEEEEKKFKAFECWLPGVMLENYEYSSNGTEELWALYLVDQWYADPKDTGDEVDDDGNLLRHKRAKERRVDIIFDNRVVS